MKLGFLILVAALIVGPVGGSLAQVSNEPVAPLKGKQEGAGDNCVTIANANEQLRLTSRPAGPEILYDAYFLPSDATVDVGLNERFNEAKRYFAYIRRNDQNWYLFSVDEVTSRSATGNDPLVKNKLLEKDSAIITLRVPDSIGGFWNRVELYIYTCGDSAPNRVSRIAVRLSSQTFVRWTVACVVAALYLLAAFVSRPANTGSLPWYWYLDPVIMTAGPDGRGSLAKLQILFFSLVVFSLVLFLLLRTGELSDVSETVLLLLGIVAVGSTAANGVDLKRNSISVGNRIWLIQKKWLKTDELAAENKAAWSDIFTRDGEFDVYRYQSFIFSLVVGAALLARGVTELASFTIPSNLMGILGLSQVVYISGKLVTSTSIGELNEAITELRELESKFKAAAFANSAPNAAVTGPIPEPPVTLKAAIARAGQVPYNAYIEKAKEVSILFQSVTGIPAGTLSLEPSFGA